MSPYVRAALALAVCGLLGGCEREPVRTTVVAPPAAAESVPPAAPAIDPAPAPATPAAPGVPAVTPPADAPSDGASLLAGKSLLIPVAGVRPESLTDMFDDARGGRRHEAIDIMAPRGTPVHAVDDGKLVKLFTSVPGGLTIYQFDTEGRLAYYYAHLDRYAPGLAEGSLLRRGELIGYVGSTGNADPGAPHLHFAVFRLGPDRAWWKGEAVNPYQALRAAQSVAARGPAQSS